jgi:hypothetical protein
MKWFKKSKKETGCCNVQFEESKEILPKDKKNSCCGKIEFEEIKPKSKTTGCCN